MVWWTKRVFVLVAELGGTRCGKCGMYVIIDINIDP